MITQDDAFTRLHWLLIQAEKYSETPVEEKDREAVAMACKALEDSRVDVAPGFDMVRK